MTNDDMKIIFREDETLKKNILDALKQSGFSLEEKNVDLILIEIPDNSESQNLAGPTENEILVKCPQGTDKKLIEEKIKGTSANAENACDELIDQLRSEMAAEIIHDCKKVGNGRGGMVSSCYLHILAVLQEEAAGYANLVKYIAADLLSKTKVTGELDEVSAKEEKKQHYLGMMQKRWMLMGGYAEYLLRNSNLPEAVMLTELSAARYEGSDSEARIYFSDAGLETLEKFDEIGRDTREIRTDNTRMIRKLMEISKRNTVYLYAERNEEGQYVISRLVTENKEKESCDIYIKFSGFLQWSVMRGAREELVFSQGRYYLNSSAENKLYEQNIRELEGVDVEMVEELVEILRGQKHGTAVIISDYAGNVEKTVNTLCRLNRGIRISSEICYHKEKDKDERWDREQLLSVTGIDGALFMDLTGRCLAIGVLVDGKATIKGNVGRGARYNSIVNYVLQQEEGNYIGLIISEDGMIDVVQNKRG